MWYSNSKTVRNVLQEILQYVLYVLKVTYACGASIINQTNVLLYYAYLCNYILTIRKQKHIYITLFSYFKSAKQYCSNFNKNSYFVKLIISFYIYIKYIVLYILFKCIIYNHCILIYLLYIAKCCKNSELRMFISVRKEIKYKNIDAISVASEYLILFATRKTSMLSQLIPVYYILIWQF